MNKIVIVSRGGLIESVYVDTDELVNVVILDYDESEVTEEVVKEETEDLIEVY
jgi:hypothetical protein